MESRLSELRRYMLPAKLDPTRSYTPREYDRTRGYRLLVHAELEACLEDLVIGVANQACKSWTLDRRPRQCLIALLAYYEGNLGAVPDEISNAGSSTKPLRTRLKVARDNYVTWVRMNNNGIRESNILRLVLPVGVLESDLDAGWLQTMDAFGSARGDTAHQALRTQQPPDPTAEYQTVQDIVAGFRKVDAKLSALAK